MTAEQLYTRLKPAATDAASGSGINAVRNQIRSGKGRSNLNVIGSAQSSNSNTNLFDGSPNKNNNANNFSSS